MVLTELASVLLFIIAIIAILQYHHNRLYGGLSYELDVTLLDESLFGFPSKDWVPFDDNVYSGKLIHCHKAPLKESMHQSELLGTIKREKLELRAINNGGTNDFFLGHRYEVRIYKQGTDEMVGYTLVPAQYLHFHVSPE